MQSEPTPTDLMNAIVDLSNATADGFSRVERELRSEMKQGFERVDTRLERIDSRLDRVETRLTSIEGEVGGIRHWMVRTDSRVDALERRKKH